MGLRETLRQLRPGSPSRGRSSIELQRRCGLNSSKVDDSSGQVAQAQPQTQLTEQTLQVWRALPSEIRHDPSMASFQLENERIHGESAETEKRNEKEREREMKADSAEALTAAFKRKLHLSFMLSVCLSVGRNPRALLLTSSINLCVDCGSPFSCRLKAGNTFFLRLIDFQIAVKSII